MTKEKQVCTSCIMDNVDEDLSFDEQGRCQRCLEFENRILKDWNHGYGHEEELKTLINNIKKKGKNKKYDCLLGYSGGLDSSYMLHLAVKQWGLRPYVFHIDAGWNLPVAESNIKKMCDKLGVELHTYKMDEEEMREIQLAWFRTGLAVLDVPQDHAFIALTDKLSKDLKIKYILNGYNISTEIVADPDSWNMGQSSTGDGKFVKDVIKKFCNIKIKKYIFTSGIQHKFLMPVFHGIKTVKPLNLVPFTKNSMIETLKNEYGYEAYGQKHFEDLLTKFLEGWWMPTKFGYDIRKSQLSSLVITGQMTRDEALDIISKPAIEEKEAMELFKEVADKLHISEKDLWDLYKLQPTKVKFKSQKRLYSFGIKLYEKLGLEKRIRK